MAKKRYLVMLDSELHEWAKEFGAKHERSISYIVNRALRSAKELSTKGEIVVMAKPDELIKPKVKRFTPPTVEQVLGYMNEKLMGDRLEAEKFVDFYASKGWLVGKAKMKDWKASVRNWMKDKKTGPSGVSKITQKNIANLEGDW